MQLHHAGRAPRRISVLSSLRCVAAFAFVFYPSTLAVASGSSGSPLSKVLTLLQDLSAKVAKDGEVEEGVYKKYFDYCDEVTTQLKFEIKTASAQKEKLESKITQFTSDIEVSVTKIETLAKEIATSQKELKDATDIRNKEKKNFDANEQELVEVVETLGKAITILEKELKKNPSFAQVAGKDLAGVIQSLTAVVDASALTIEDRSKLVQLVQAQAQAGSSEDSEDQEDGEEEQPAYESKSGSIVDVLQDLQTKAEAQLDELRKAEKTTAHNFKILKQSLEDKIDADTTEMNDEKVEKGKAEEGKAAAEGDLTVAVADLKQATEGLAESQADCIQVAADHEASQASRKAELKTIEEALTILQQTTGGAAQQSYSFVQVAAKSGGKAKAGGGMDLSHSTVVTLVKQMAQQTGSADLAQLASRIFAVSRYSAASGDDPFAKVKGLINDMILKLQKEKEAEQNEKQYCDAELAKTTSKKGELDDDIADLTAKIDQALAHSAALKQEVNDIQAELQALAQEQGQADSIRAEEKADYEASKADLEEGLNGVRKALSVLREYYAAGDDAASLLQDNNVFSNFMEQPAKPVSHSASSAGGGVIGVLEVVESDFATNLAKLETEEATSQDAYDKATQENKVSKAQKDQDVKYKTQEFTALDKTISEFSTDRETAATELGAVEEYFAKLKERCIAKPDTYEVAKKKREAEIAGLKEALSTLKGEAALAQQEAKQEAIVVLAQQKATHSKAQQGKVRAGAKRSMRGGQALS